MKSTRREGLALSCTVIILATCSSLFGDTQRVASARGTSVPEQLTPANIIQYVRDRFEVPETVKVDAAPLHASPVLRFYQTVVTVDDGKQKRASNVFITNDALCFVVGDIFALNGSTNADIIRCLRDAAKLSPTAEVAVGPFASTAFPDFLKSTVKVRDGTKIQDGDLFVTRDRRIGILGMVLPFRRDFVQRLINTKNQPSVGPSNAPVTIVEYADLECPRCAYFQKFLEEELIPRYGNKVRIVFKEFPLTFHTWSTTGAVANECAYVIDPSKFLNYRTLIFGSQATINAANVRERMLSLGDEAGLDRLKLSSCVDSKASLSRIEDCEKEVTALGVRGTPTFIVNGRYVVRLPSGADLYKIIDEAIASADKRN